MLRYLTALCLGICVAHTVLAGEPKEIHLKDGAVITGTVEAFDGEHYTIRSHSLGELRIHESHIAAILAPSASAGASPAPAGTQPGPTYSRGDLAAMQQQLLGDAETLGMIQSLQNNPQIQAIINDPQLMQAIYSGDLVTLQQDPRIQALMEDPTVQRIQSRALSGQ